jgi:hypothetical protein
MNIVVARLFENYYHLAFMSADKKNWLNSEVWHIEVLGYEKPSPHYASPLKQLLQTLRLIYNWHI